MDRVYESVKMNWQSLNKRLDWKHMLLIVNL